MNTNIFTGKIKPWRELVDNYGVDVNGNVDVSKKLSHKLWKMIIKSSMKDLVMFAEDSSDLELIFNMEKSQRMNIKLPKTFFSELNQLTVPDWMESFNNSSRLPEFYSLFLARGLDGKITGLNKFNLECVLNNIMEVFWGNMPLSFIQNNTFSISCGSDPLQFITKRNTNGLAIRVTATEQETEKVLSEFEMISELLCGFKKASGGPILYVGTIAQFLQSETLIDILQDFVQTRQIEEYPEIIFEVLRKGYEETILCLTKLMIVKRQKEQKTQYNNFFGEFKNVSGKMLKQAKEQVLEEEKNKAQEMLNQYYRQLDIIRDKEIEVYFAHKQDDNLAQELRTVMEGSGVLNPEFLNSKTIAFTIVVPLSSWREQDWEACHDGYFSELDSLRENPALRKLATKIFEREWTLMMEQRLRVNLGTGQINRKDFTPMQGVPNPHHYHHDCFQQNGALIVEAVRRGDYVTMMMQAQSAVSGINFSEGATVRPFFNDLNSDRYADLPCITDGEGKLMTLREALNRLEKEEE